MPAVVRLVQRLGGAAGTALLAAVAAAAGFHGAFLWSVGLTLVALLPCLALPARKNLS
ncbi:hypothetical protein [Amycolatopsis sp.]|uniref:hypothetical protein n=1 Tax=Amycolatopsis sp. TaxID=37632 RepID=UPI002D7F93FF|nr:hypothetical protein [Amycolatopsis sp.]HET6706156.1 hypothetical protein [Amycolatopsis sp.]